MCLTLETSSNFDKDYIKANLPIGFVLSQYEFDIEEQGGELVTLCPFHDDTAPSLHVFGEQLNYWRCMSCGVHGDVLEFIRKHEHLTFLDALAKANVLLVAASEWAGPTVGRKKDILSPAQASEVIEASREDPNFHLIEALIEEKHYPFTSEWLINQFLIGTYNDKIVIPYISNTGQYVAYKTRTPTTKPFSAAGSSFKDVLYNEFALGANKPVLLCGSESDVWAATYHLGAEFDVVGAPTGETANPIQAIKLINRTVYIAFDGDNAGRVGASKWRDALAENQVNVYTVILPEGEDVASVTNLEFYVQSARKIAIALPVDLSTEPTGYFKGSTQLSNWTFEPHTHVENISGVGEMFEGVILPTGDKAILSFQDCKSRGTLVSWSNRHGVSWLGSEKEAQLIWAGLQSVRHLLESKMCTDTTGLYKDTFIWADGKIGPSRLTYARPASDVGFEKHLSLPEGPANAAHIFGLRSLNKREVMDPILAWLALSVVRSRFEEFPALGVMGSAGTGKSTTLSTVVPLLTGSDYTLTLTGTTPYALNAALAATNAFPVHIDEFRDEARKETKDKMSQFIRDGFNGYGAQRGGGSEGWASVTSLDIQAPMIISGETSFTETSHIERIIYVTMPYGTMNPQALAAVREWGQIGLARTYLSWVSQGLAEERWDFSTARCSRGAGDLPNRIQDNLGMLHWGWELLQDFVKSLGSSLSEPDFTRVEAQLRMMTNKSPIEEAIRWAIGVADSGVDLVASEDCIYINVPTMYFNINKNGSFKLPGDAEAISAYLVSRYQATYVTRHNLMGRPEKVLKLTRQIYDVN